MMHFHPWTFWDYALFFGVLAMVTAISIAHSPKIKAAIVCIPIPFILASLAVDKPVGPGVAFGWIYLMAALITATFLYNRLRVPAVLSVMASMLLYIVLAKITEHFSLPGFWVSCLLLLGISVLYLWWVPDPRETAVRDPIALWKKLPVLALTVAALIVMKKELEGFITTFPMVTMITMVESKHCMRTVTRHFVYVQPALVAMVATVYLTQFHLPLIGALAVSLAPFFLVSLLLVYIALRKAHRERQILERWDEVL